MKASAMSKKTQVLMLHIHFIEPSLSTTGLCGSNHAIFPVEEFVTCFTSESIDICVRTNLMKLQVTVFSK